MSARATIDVQTLLIRRTVAKPRESKDYATWNFQADILGEACLYGMLMYDRYSASLHDKVHKATRLRGYNRLIVVAHAFDVDLMRAHQHTSTKMEAGV